MSSEGNPQDKLEQAIALLSFISGGGDGVPGGGGGGSSIASSSVASASSTGSHSGPVSRVEGNSSSVDYRFAYNLLN